MKRTLKQTCRIVLGKCPQTGENQFAVSIYTEAAGGWNDAITKYFHGERSLATYLHEEGWIEDPRDVTSVLTECERVGG